MHRDHAIAAAVVLLAATALPAANAAHRRVHRGPEEAHATLALGKRRQTGARADDIPERRRAAPRRSRQTIAYGDLGR